MNEKNGMNDGMEEWAWNGNGDGMKDKLDIKLQSEKKHRLATETPRGFHPPDPG